MGEGDGFGMIQVYDIYYALFFTYILFSITIKDECWVKQYSIYIDSDSF